MANQENIKKAVFAGGCFWCMEPPFDALEGVIKTTSGYSGGPSENPSYEEVSGGGSGHIEVLEVTYDAEKISYEKLLETFWRNIDPFDAEGQFCDKGEQYSTAIFYNDVVEKEVAELQKQKLKERFSKDIATKLIPAQTFWPAEEYHQNYYQKNPIRYKYYRYACGRDKVLNSIWND